METLEPAIMWLAGLCAAVLSIWGVASKVSASVKQPYKELFARVDKLEDRVERNEDHLEKDLKKLDKLSRISQFDLRNQSLMLEHLATGNHNKELEEAAQETKRFMAEEAARLE